MTLIVPLEHANIAANADAHAYYQNKVTETVRAYNHHFLICELKAAFAGISALAASGVGITASAVIIHAAGIAGGALLLGAIATTGVGIVAIAASIIFWIVMSSQSNIYKAEKEIELNTLHAEVLRNVNKDPNFYANHMKTA